MSALLDEQGQDTINRVRCLWPATTHLVARMLAIEATESLENLSAEGCVERKGLPERKET